jgi:hypothetical protein
MSAQLPTFQDTFNKLLPAVGEHFFVPAPVVHSSVNHGAVCLADVVAFYNKVFFW